MAATDYKNPLESDSSKSAEAADYVPLISHLTLTYRQKHFNSADFVIDTRGEHSHSDLKSDWGQPYRPHTHKTENRYDNGLSNSLDLVAILVIL